jgi:hypothetical protein
MVASPRRIHRLIAFMVIAVIAGACVDIIGIERLPRGAGGAGGAPASASAGGAGQDAGIGSSQSAGGVRGQGGLGGNGGTGGADPCEGVSCPGAECCNGDCVDTEFDPEHCGSCEDPCDLGDMCFEADCFPPDSCSAAVGVPCPKVPAGHLLASYPDADDHFGFSVAIAGDTIAIGAYFEDSNAVGIGGNENNDGRANSGAVYVFVRTTGGAWVQQAYLKASTPDPEDQFGWSVALSGNTLVVGAPGEDSTASGVAGDESNNGALSSGAAYVFVRDAGGAWSQQAYLKASNTGASDQFGYSVSIHDDLVAVGTPFEDSNETGLGGTGSNDMALQSGAAYVFVRSGSTWAPPVYVKASNTGADDGFGESVAVSGDTLVVGALQEDSAAMGIGGNEASNAAGDAGAAYVFVRDGGGAWSQQVYLKASNTGAADRFGRSVAASGDTVVVGASNEASSALGVGGSESDNSAPNAGAAYVFVRDGGASWSQQAYLKASNTDMDDRFGWSVAVDADVVVVGARWESSAATGAGGSQSDNSAPRSGAAYVYTRSAGVWSHALYLKSSSSTIDDEFGRAVDVSGSSIIAGAFGENAGSLDNSGGAHVYRLGP